MKTSHLHSVLALENSSGCFMLLIFSLEDSYQDSAWDLNYCCGRESGLEPTLLSSFSCCPSYSVFFLGCPFACVHLFWTPWVYLVAVREGMSAVAIDNKDIGEDGGAGCTELLYTAHVLKLGVRLGFIGRTVGQWWMQYKAGCLKKKEWFLERSYLHSCSIEKVVYKTALRCAYKCLSGVAKLQATEGNRDSPGGWCSNR